MRFLLPFFDDSTLIFAATMRAKLAERGHDVITAMSSAAHLSERQIATHLPMGADITIDDAFFSTPEIAGFDAVIISKAPEAIRRQIAKGGIRQRPAYIAFQPGLEFTPDRGRKNRRDFDIVFLYSADHRDKFKRAIKSPRWQHVSFGHPYFMTPKAPDLSGRKNVYFFAQAISPATLNSRRFVVDVLATLAERHPDRDVFVKLRHLPGENDNHVHRETYAYPWLLERYFPDAPPNLKLTACTMAEALDDAAIAITCTSTAVMDAISAGVPAMIYLDYVENYHDQYARPMRNEFAASGLISSIPQIMDLEASAPDEDWMRQHFRGDELFEEIETAVGEFKRVNRT